MEYFVLEVTALASAELMGIEANAAALPYRKIRIVIANKLESEASDFAEGVELDESYFVGVRKGKRGRGAAGKVTVFGILTRGGRVYAQIIDNTRTDTLMPIIRSKIKTDSVVYTDSYRSYNALDVSEFKHYRVNNCSLFKEGRNHINGIENFWSQPSGFAQI